MITNAQIILSDALHRGFVNPEICQHIVQTGLNPALPYTWKVVNNKATLFCSSFDLDEYYKETFAMLDETNKPDYIFPAFQLSDIEKILPPWLCTRNEDGIYEISVQTYLKAPTLMHSRLPDAFALMYLECVRLRLIDVDKASTALISS